MRIVRSGTLSLLASLLVVVVLACERRVPAAELRMQGNYVRPAEQISLQVTPSKLIGSHGAETVAFDYEVKNIAGANVTIEVMFSEEGKTGALELFVHLRDDGGLDISSAIPN